MSFISSLGEWLRKVSKSFMSATISGKTITLTRHNGDTVTLTTQDTTYELASQSTSGLMSSTDKQKLDAIPSDAVFTDTVTTVSVTGSGNAITDITASNGALTAEKNQTFSLSDHTHSGYVKKTGDTMSGKLTVPLLISELSGNVQTKTDISSYGVAIKDAYAPYDGTPANGIVIETVRNNNWGGQLYLPNGNGSNIRPSYNGWENGVYGTWKALAYTSDLPALSNFSVTSNTNIDISNGYIDGRKYGRVFIVRIWTVKLTQTIAAWSSLKIGTVSTSIIKPAYFESAQYFVVEGSAYNPILRINYSGEIYVVTQSQQIPANTIFHCTFIGISDI